VTRVAAAALLGMYRTA